MLDVLIKDARVMDGSGKPSYRGDVGIRDGLITLDTKNESAGQTIDADGLAVSPGFVDLHTHYDAQVLWDGSASPSNLHGTTTVIGGNCGFSIAPLREDTANYHMRMMAAVEGMPFPALEKGPEWNWGSFEEWMGRLEGQLSINAGFLVGHSALRLAVMGMDAVEAKASDDQIEAMQGLLATCLDAGGMGFSSAQKTVLRDGDGNFVPSFHASPEELYALSEVLQRYPGTSLGFASNGIGRYRHPTEDIELMTQMSRRAGRPINWNTVRIRPDDPDFVDQQLNATDISASQGGRIIGMTNPKPFKGRMSFAAERFWKELPGWGAIYALPLEQRLIALAKPEVQKQLREGVEKADLRDSQRSLTKFANWDVSETFSPGTKQYEERSLSDIARERNRDPFDVALDIAIEDDLRTVFLASESNSIEAWRERARVWLDPRTVVGGADAGAHITSMVGSTYTTVLLEHARERELLSLEEAVRQLTDVPARFYGLEQRGRIAEGWHADLVVFDPETVGAGPERFQADMPGHASRLYADAKGIEHVFVNGGEVVRANKPTGASTGRVLRSGKDTNGVTV